MSSADSTGNTCFVELKFRLPSVTVSLELRAAFSACSLSFSAVSLLFCGKIKSMFNIWETTSCQNMYLPLVEDFQLYFLGHPFWLSFYLAQLELQPDSSVFCGEYRVH